jgi:NAD(P)-dependent dehydrogenase (short-subunit alcohol dehydrogenase family)
MAAGSLIYGPYLVSLGVPGYTAYYTTKHGMIGFTRALALEVVNADKIAEVVRYLTLDQANGNHRPSD